MFNTNFFRFRFVQQIKYTPFPASVNKNFHYKNFHHFCVSKELGLQANVRLKARAVLTIVQVSMPSDMKNKIDPAK